MRKKAWILLLFATLIALLCACSDTAQQPETEKPKIRIGGTTYFLPTPQNPLSENCCKTFLRQP